MADRVEIRVILPLDVTIGLNSSSARNFLAQQGLPTQELLVQYCAQDSVSISRFADREFLVIGRVGEDYLAIDVNTGEVVAVSKIDSSIWHISESVMTLSRILETFTDLYPFCGDEDNPDECESAAREFGSKLQEIDPSSLSEDPGFWNTLLMDIAIGDYRQED